MPVFQSDFTYLHYRVRECFSFSTSLAKLGIIFLIFTVWVGVARSHCGLIYMSLMIDIWGPFFICLFFLDTLSCEVNSTVFFLLWWLSFLLICGSSLCILMYLSDICRHLLYCILQFPLSIVSLYKKKFGGFF